MMHDLSLADVLFIVLICLLIWGIMTLVGRKRPPLPGPGAQQEKGDGDSKQS